MTDQVPCVHDAIASFREAPGDAPSSWACAACGTRFDVALPAGAEIGALRTRVADDRRRFRAIEVAWDADRAELTRLRELIARRSRPIAILLAATNPTADPVDTYGLTVADFAAVEAMRADIASRLMPERQRGSIDVVE
jgi:hypothetical protein